MKLFQEKHIYEFFQSYISRIKNEIEHYNYTNVDEKDISNISNELYNRYKIKPIEISLENREVNVTMIQIPSSNFPSGYDVTPGKKYNCAKVEYTYTLPKDHEYLMYLPYNFQINPINFETNSQKIIFSYQTLYGSIELSDQIKEDVKNWIIEVQNKVEEGLIAINRDIEKYNNEIKDFIPSLLSQEYNKRKTINKQNQDLNDF